MPFKALFLAFSVAIAGQVQADYYFDGGCREDYFPIPCSKIDGFISCDYLYLRAFEDDVSNIWIPSNTVEFETSDGRVLSRTIAKGQDPRFQWNSGYRVTGGLSCSGWDVKASWTHFTSPYSSQSHQRLGWKVSYKTVDLLMQYSFNINPRFNLKAFGGLREARINQKRRGHLTGHVNEGVEEDIGVSTRLSGIQKFDGLGFLFGIEGDLNMGSGVSFYAKGDAGTLFGKYHLKGKTFNNFGGEDANFFYAHLTQNACQYFIETFVGVRWKTSLCSGVNLIFQLEAEHHSYFNHNRMSGNGNFNLDGGSFSAGVEF